MVNCKLAFDGSCHLSASVLELDRSGLYSVDSLTVINHPTQRRTSLPVRTGENECRGRGSEQQSCHLDEALHGPLLMATFDLGGKSLSLSSWPVVTWEELGRKRNNGCLMGPTRRDPRLVLRRVVNSFPRSEFRLAPFALQGVF